MKWHWTDKSFWLVYLLHVSVLGKFIHPIPEVLELLEMVGILDKDISPHLKEKGQMEF